MASPDKSKRKILKAKKTMPPSCRKQAEILSKSKNVEALKTKAVGDNVSSGNQNSSTGVVSSKCGLSENDASLLDSNKNSVCIPKSKVFSQNLTKPLEVVGSETRLEYIEEQAMCLHQKTRETVESPRKLLTQGARDSQNISESGVECRADVRKSFLEQHEEDCNTKSICSPSSTVQMPKSTVTSTLDDKIVDKRLSYLKANSNSESHNKRQNDILSSDIHFVPVDKIPKVANSVISSDCAAGILKSEPCRTYHSRISDRESTYATRLSSLDTDHCNSHKQKKRMFSENKENVKRTKTSEQINENICVSQEKETAILEKVRHLIRQETYSANYKLFDNKLKELTERIGKTQCRNKHEAIAGELFAKITKLQRCIKTIWLSQRNCSKPNSLSNDTAYKVANSETTDSDENPEPVISPNKRRIYVNSEPSTPSEYANEKIHLWQDHDKAISESNDHLSISLESSNLTTPITSSPTDSEKIPSGNSNSSPDAKIKAVGKKLDSVIDLTNEGLSNCNPGSPISVLESSIKAISISKETISVAPNAAQVLESFEHLPPLPPPPSPPPEVVDRVRDTLPPQKPELKVKRVLKPRGIALTWNITKINPRCAPVESYHLFLCHENPSNKLIWKKIGEIKALPLPMACTLSQFLASNKYYFTVQSKDIFGRYGPFCDVKSIPGFSENLT